MKRLVLFLSLLALTTATHGAPPSSGATSVSCSTYAATAKLNEVAFSGGSNSDKDEFIEVYFISDVTTSGWKVCHDSTTTCVSIPNNTYTAGTFLVLSLTSNSLNNNTGEVILLDGTGKGLDHISWDNKSSCSSNVWDLNAACGGDPCLSNHNASDKDFARLPTDGTGSWSDNNDDKTQGCSNSSCTPVSTTPGRFNAVDVGQNAVTGVIHTKIAGQAFSLDVYALNNPGNSVLPSYTGTLSVYLVNASSSANCASMTVLQSLGSFTYTGAGSGKDNGKKTLTTTYADAAPNVRVKMVDSSAGVTTCSSDAFAIRPYSLAHVNSLASAIVATDTDWETAGTSRNLDNNGAIGGTVHKAGRPFTLRAQDWSATASATQR